VFIKRLGTEDIVKEVDVSGLMREEVIVRVRSACSNFDMAQYWIDDHQIDEQDGDWYCEY
jgi:hypothetical protein